MVTSHALQLSFAFNHVGFLSLRILHSLPLHTCTLASGIVMYNKYRKEKKRGINALLMSFKVFSS